MKTIQLLLMLVIFSSCSVQRNISVSEIKSNSIITSSQDIIKVRERLISFIDVGGVYNFRMIGDKCVDVSVNKNKK